MTIIDKIKDGYLDYIRMEMRKIVSDEPKRGVTFNDNTFVFRSTAKTSLDTIVRIYRNAQN